MRHHSFEVVLGRGKKTYLRHHPASSRKTLNPFSKNQRGADIFTLVYGRLCIAEMFEEENFWRWKSHHEIKNYHPSSGPTNPLVNISHIVLHEFAHYIQANLGQRSRGSVHNTEFYSILKRLYSDNAQDIVYSSLLLAVQPCGPTTQKLLTHIEKNDCSTQLIKNVIVGEFVAFDHKNKRHQGTVTRLNKRRATVMTNSTPSLKALIPYSKILKI